MRTRYFQSLNLACKKVYFANKYLFCKNVRKLALNDPIYALSMLNFSFFDNMPLSWNKMLKLEQRQFINKESCLKHQI